MNDVSLAHPRVVLRALICGVIGLAAFALAGSPSSQAASPAGLPGGRWMTYANGNDVLALQLHGTTLWAGTRSGGLVRWNTSDKTYVQFLRPQDPLSGNTIHDLAVGEDGRVWMATDGGLTVLDDKGSPERSDDTWHTYTSENTFKGLSTNAIRAVALDGTVVWVGTVQTWDPANEAWVGGGLSRLDTAGTAATSDDTWAPVITFASTFKKDPIGNVKIGLASDNINDILVTPKHNLWVAASPHWKQEKLDNGSELITAWQRSYGGLSYVDPKGTADPADDVWTTTDCQGTSFTIVCDMQELAMDANNYVWATIRGRGVMFFKADEPQIQDDVTRRFDLPDRPDGVIGDTTEAIAFGPSDSPTLKNTVWIGRSKGGLSVVDHHGTLSNKDDDEWNFGKEGSFSTKDGLASNRIQGLVIGNGKAWIGTGVWFGVGGGVGELGLDDLTFLPNSGLVTKGLPTNFLTALAVGQTGSRWAGHVWLGTGSRIQWRFGSGVVDLDTKGTREEADDVFTNYTTLGTDRDGKAPWTGLAGDNVHAVAMQGDRVWFGSLESTWDGLVSKYTDGGLTVFDGTNWTARTKPASGPGLRDNSVSSIAIGCSDEVLIGTGNRREFSGAGVDVLKPGASVHRPETDTWSGYDYKKNAELASHNTTDISVDCVGGYQWFAAMHHINAKSEAEGGGVSRLKPGPTPEWAQYHTATKPPANGFQSYKSSDLLAEAMAVQAGPNGVAWVGAYGTSDMHAADLISEKPFYPAILNYWDGSKWTNKRFERAGWVSSIARDADGRLWVGTSRGGTARDSASPDVWRDDRFEGGLFVSDGTGWITETVTSAGIPSNDISAVTVGPDGDIWISTEGWGLARFMRGASVSTPTPTVDAPSPTPSDTPEATSTTDEPTPTVVLPTPTPTGGTGATATATRRPTSTPGGPAEIFIPYIAKNFGFRAAATPTRTPRGSVTRTPTRAGSATARPSATRTPGGPTATPPRATPTIDMDELVEILYLPHVSNKVKLK